MLGANSEADNTVRECKNQYVLTYLSLLVSQGRFKTTGFCSLRKGHTHCRVGNLVTNSHCNVMWPHTLCDVFRKLWPLILTFFVWNQQLAKTSAGESSVVELDVNKYTGCQRCCEGGVG